MAIKKILLTLLGEKRYLTLLAGTFQRLFSTGLLGKDYQDVYFLKEFIREGDWCVDIGAHLGYYTLELSRLVKNSGKVIAIEPMPKFNKTLQLLLESKKADNVILHQVALGGDGDFVEMGIPQVGKTKKFAYARVMKYSEHFQYIESVKVKNETGDALLKEVPRLDFIKCDVEGLEVQVFSSMADTLARHHPILICELVSKEERIKLFDLIRHLGYQPYRLEKGRLHYLDVRSDDTVISHNHYFIPQEKLERLGHLIA
ncbi:FkbM family methyltransferase [Flavitalea flava]